jgi:hypothetical protein
MRRARRRCWPPRAIAGPRPPRCACWARPRRRWAGSTRRRRSSRPRASCSSRSAWRTWRSSRWPAWPRWRCSAATCRRRCAMPSRCWRASATVRAWKAPKSRCACCGSAGACCRPAPMRAPPRCWPTRAACWPSARRASAPQGLSGSGAGPPRAAGGRRRLGPFGLRYRSPSRPAMQPFDTSGRTAGVLCSPQWAYMFEIFGSINPKSPLGSCTST